jgi:hypothetical protein
MGARDWVREHFGEATARTIERLAGAFFGDDQFVECRLCRTPVPANLVTEWGCCPACQEASGERTTDALLAQREALLASHQESRMELDRIEALLAARRDKN